MKFLSNVRKYLKNHRFANPDVKIFFLHIPKCGGSSMTESLTRLYAPSFRFHIEPSPSQNAARLLSIPWQRECECMLSYFMGHPQIRCITGHFLWSEVCYENFHENWRYITVLREPVDRWLSNYFYGRYKTHSNFRKIEQDLEAFLDTERSKRFGSNLVRFLSGHAEATAEALEVAKNNVERFDVVGFLDNIDRFQADIERLLGCRVSFPHKNASLRNELREEYRANDDIMQRIRELCAPDLELYRYAKDTVV